MHAHSLAVDLLEILQLYSHILWIFKEEHVHPHKQPRRMSSGRCPDFRAGLKAAHDVLEVASRQLGAGGISICLHGFRFHLDD